MPAGPPFARKADRRSLFSPVLPMPIRLFRVLPLLFLAGCTMNLGAVEGPDANAIATTWPYQSMVFAARTTDGVFVVDLGWGGADRALRRGLAQIGARPE